MWTPAQAQDQTATETDIGAEEQKKKKNTQTVESSEAGGEAQNTYGMEEVVVTATRTEMLREEVPAVMDVIDTFEIKTTVDENISDILKKNSSVDVIDYPDVLSGVSIRGFRPEYSGITKHYLILIDGRPAGTTNLATLLKDNVARVEVLKGPASSLYGAEAMGGVINVITKKSTGEIKTEIEVGGGSFDTHTESISSGGGITHWLDYDASFSNRGQIDNFRMGNGDERANTSFEERHGAFRLGSSFLENWRLDAKVDYYIGDDIGSPNALFYGDTKPSYKDVERYGGDLTLSGEWGRNLTRATFFASHEESENTYQYKGQPVYKGYRGTYDWIGGQFQDTYSFLQHDITLGFDYQDIDVETQKWNSSGSRVRPNSPDNGQENVGLFADAFMRFWNERLILNAGLRYDWFEISTTETPYLDDAVIGSSNFDRVSPRAGVKLFLTPDRMFQLHGTVGTAFVPPQVGNMFIYAETEVQDVTMVTKGNPGLDPETSFTWDAGLTFEKKDYGLRADLTYFDTTVDDKITRVKVSDTVTSYANTDSAEMNGLELETSWNIGAVMNWNRILELFANATYFFKAREELLNEETGESETRDIYNVSDWKLNVGVNYDDDRFFGRFLARYMGERKDNDWYTPGYPEITYDSFIVCDLVMGVRFLKHHTVTLNIENLFDKYYYEKPEYPLPGRAVYAKYTLSF